MTGVPCPAGCGLELPAGDLAAQAAHMEAEHPEVVAARLEEIGETYEPAALSRLAALVEDWRRYGQMIGHDPAWRDEMRRAVVVEMRSAVATLDRACQFGKRPQ